MTREEAIHQGKEQLNSPLNDALGFAYDQGFQVQGGAGGGLPDETPYSQTEIDAAVVQVTQAHETLMQDLKSHLDLDKEQLTQIKESVSKAVRTAVELITGQSQASQPQDQPVAQAK